ncbi:MAG: leucyl aminopeptidase [Gammaproteobacteria bacterium]|nr:leucyl aminopeptidase [Gammaproteobacteria bacterium]
MKYSVCIHDQLRDSGDCLVTGVFSDADLAPSTALADTRLDGWIKRFLDNDEFKGKPGEVLCLTPATESGFKRILVLGLGKEAELDASTYCKALAKAAQQVNAIKAATVCCTLAEIEVQGQDALWKSRQIARHFRAASYQFSQLKSGEDQEPKLTELCLMAPQESSRDALELGAKQGDAIALGMHLAKDLGNLPGNYCTPSYLAEKARELAETSDKLSLQVLEEAEMDELGMGSLLSVSRGSRQPAKLIIMNYQGAADSEQPVVLVGKGITFDSGGISIKPAAAMDEMKFDMCGAASVFGTMKTVTELKLPINLICIVPASENLPDGDASKPGDIVTSMSGTTIEVLNTDAEGRLVLCDALTYAKRFDPALVIDIATLTGACVVALGKHISGLLGNDDGLCEALYSAGETACDPVWRLPMNNDYDEQLKSNFADVANVGGRDAGTITAACFLGRFTRDFTWAHLDIAGTAWYSGGAKGASGRPVPLLTQFLLDRIG